MDTEDFLSGGKESKLFAFIAIYKTSYYITCHNIYVVSKIWKKN